MLVWKVLGMGGHCVLLIVYGVLQRVIARWDRFCLCDLGSPNNKKTFLFCDRTSCMSCRTTDVFDRLLSCACGMNLCMQVGWMQSSFRVFQCLQESRCSMLHALCFLSCHLQFWITANQLQGEYALNSGGACMCHLVACVLALCGKRCG